MLYFLLYLGLSPTDSFGEAMADMIVGGVDDLFQALIKIFSYKDAAKQVSKSIIAFCFLYCSCLYLPVLFPVYHYSQA